MQTIAPLFMVVCMIAVTMRLSVKTAKPADHNT
jgi:hypothetical protein